MVPSDGPARGNAHPPLPARGVGCAGETEGHGLVVGPHGTRGVRRDSAPLQGGSGPGHPPRVEEVRARRAPDLVAVWTARASLEPQGERGPPKGDGGWFGAGRRTATQIASEAVPEQSWPVSRRAWTLASVAVVARLTSPASETAAGTTARMLIVPGA